MIVIYDIDGVLADARLREHYLSARPKDWNSFFAEVSTDTVIAEARDRLVLDSAEYEVILVSGRPERCRADTTDWLERNGIVASRTILRPDSDRRRASEFKVDAVQAIAEPVDVAAIYDDDEKVVNALATMGYSAFLWPIGDPLR